MLTESLLVLAVILMLFVSFCGWGLLLAKFSGFGHQEHFGLMACVGCALFLVIGGVLNLMAWISPPVVQTMVALGIAVYLTMKRGRLSKIHKWHVGLSWRRMLVLAVVLCVLAAPTAVNLGTSWASVFNSADDFKAYLVFPQKMLANGELGDEPFNMRRMETSLGGQSFLHAVLLTFVPLHRLNSLEWGLGALLLAGMLIGHAKILGLPWAWRAGLGAIVALIPWPVVNTTSVITGAALFVALLYVTRWYALPGREGGGWANNTQRVNAAPIALAGVIVGGLASAKSSHIVGVAAILPVAYLVRGDMPFGSRLKELLLVGVTATIAVLPWMISMYNSNGTFLYPALGQGFHAPREYIAFPETGVVQLKEVVKDGLELITSPPMLTAILAVIIAQGSSRMLGARLGLAMVIGAIGGGLLLAAINPYGPYHSIRHLTCFVLATVLFLAIEYLATSKSTGRDTKVMHRVHVVAPVLLAFLLGAYLPEIERKFTNVWYMAFHSESDPAYSLAEQKDTLAILQNRSLSGERILVYAPGKFMWDYARNPVYVMDEPYVVSPPPGLPKNADDMGDYLVSHDIKKVVVDIRGESCESQQGAKEYPELCRLVGKYHTVVEHNGLVMLDMNRNLSTES